MKKRKIIGLVLLISFIVLTILLLTNNISSFDSFIYKYFFNIRNKFFDNFFIFFTRLGDIIPVVIITICLLIVLNKENRYILGSSMIISLLINQGLKHIIQRPRPPIEERLIEQGGYSYPSGHSMMAMCLYGVLIYLINTKLKNKKLKIILTIILSVIIILIGISRIYVRVHYPSDVLGAYLLTILILIINITLINNHIRGNMNDKDVDK